MFLRVKIISREYIFRRNVCRKKKREKYIIFAIVKVIEIDCLSICLRTKVVYTKSNVFLKRYIMFIRLC